MKKISLLKKLSLAAVSVAAISPFALTATSCSKKSAILVRYASYKEIEKGIEDKQLDCLHTGNFSDKELLLGTKKFHDGNYILFLGTNSGSTTINFFAGDTMERRVDQWFENNDYITTSYWYKDIVSSKIISTKIDRDFGLVTFIDNFDHKFYDTKGHEIYIADNDGELIEKIENITPFEKWGSSGRIPATRTFTKKYLKYEWDDESVTEDDYIRQDDQAKAYRKIMELGAAMFPVIEEKRTTTFDTSATCNPQMVIYKDGRLMEIVATPTTFVKDPKVDDKNTTTLFGTINKYFTPEEEEDPE